jgi:hypothetical protein
MVNETCIFCGFKSSKCLKGCFYLWMWPVFASIKQWPWPKDIPIYVIMTFIYVSLYFVYIYILFERKSKAKSNFILTFDLNYAKTWPLPTFTASLFWESRHSSFQWHMIKLTSKWTFLDGNGIFQCKWLVFASIKQWPWPKDIPIYVIMTFISEKQFYLDLWP